MINRLPVRIRNNVDSYDDPYISDESLEEYTECTQCGSVYMQGRWYLRDKIPEKAIVGETHKTICPACRKQEDSMPGGVLKITGDFFWKHEEEVLNLIRNESNKAQAINPLERIMSIDANNGVVEITTTNEKLAQRIGRALQKAYSGHVEYKWSGDTKLVRVLWDRQD